MARTIQPQDLNVDRDRDLFLRELLRELSGVLQDAIGLEDAEGLISIVGSRIGSLMNDEYRNGLERETLSLEEVAAVLTDLKRRIQGEFKVENISDTHIEYSNSQCPFGNHVKDRPSLCMMTSNVFGRIAAENLGYARVEISKSFAKGDGRCCVKVYMEPDDTEAGDESREYFKAG